MVAEMEESVGMVCTGSGMDRDMIRVEVDHSAATALTLLRLQSILLCLYDVAMKYIDDGVSCNTAMLKK